MRWQMSRISLKITLFGGKGYQNEDGQWLNNCWREWLKQGFTSQLSLLFNTFEIPIINFVFGCTGYLSMCKACSSFGERGLSFIVAHRLLTVVASVADQGFYSTCSTAASHGLSCPMAGGIFLNQGQNLWLLHWWVDSYPLYHQGSPYNKNF